MLIVILCLHPNVPLTFMSDYEETRLISDGLNPSGHAARCPLNLSIKCQKFLEVLLILVVQRVSVVESAAGCC